ncbi:YfhO family protein [Streptomyces sp. BI20]|uniref:YfhO family protein n=1 Tax=Streptomyces sp. BI20 TaxID=3403460 RepID=UPI003C72824F
MRTSPRRTSAAAAGWAGLLAALALCAGDAVARVFPFGPLRRSVNDLGNQFVPFHAHLWDLLRGRADGGLLLNWSSGFGSSFLPDYGTYLSSPFAPLVALFPRDRIDLAVYAITVLKVAVAAAAMAWLLRTVRRGPAGPAAVLGAGYALSGWTVAEAAYNPMWLDGLIAFPLLCLTGEWALRARRPVLGVLVPAVWWAANFYTAYMATLGAVLFLLLRLWTRGLPVRAAGVVTARAVARTAAGIALAAPLLVPVYLGSRHAYPGRFTAFAPVGAADWAARLLPATYSFSSPAVFVAGGTLVAALALPFTRRAAVAGRVRWGWTGLVLAVALSFQWEPTHLAWHVFATPNGSPYRQGFVFVGLLTLAAWAAWPGLSGRALLGGLGLAGGLGLLAAGSTLVWGWAWALYGLGLAGAGLGWWGWRRADPAGRARAGRRARVTGALLVTGVLLGQAAATTAYADRRRLGILDDYPVWGAEHDARAAALAGADTWPRARVDPGRPALGGNDPMLLGGQGAAYYSSHTSAVWVETWSALGAGWTSRGRSLQSLDNPVTDALFGVGARLAGGPDPIRRPAARTLPLVTLRPEGAPRPVYGSDPFRNQEALLGARVYEEPVAPGVCRAGTSAYLWAPDHDGTVRLGPGGRPVRPAASPPRNRAGMAGLGVSKGAATPVLFDRAPGRAETPWRLGCLDGARLDAAVAALRAGAPTRVEVGARSVRAEFAPGARGTAVLAAPRIAGWTCGGRPAETFGGLTASPVGAAGAGAAGATTLTCTFRPPGLRAGTALAGAAALGLAGWAWWAWRSRRRRPTIT